MTTLITAAKETNREIIQNRFVRFDEGFFDIVDF